MVEKLSKVISDVLEEDDITGFVETRFSPIKGTLEKENIEYVYFQDNENKNYDEQWDEVFDRMAARRDCDTDGTMMLENIVIITPKNILLHGISFSGPDPQNWIRGFERAMKEHGMLGGKIVGPKMTYNEYIDKWPDTEDYVNLVSYKNIGKNFDFILTDGTHYKLSDCEIYRIFGDIPIYEKKIKGIREVLKGRK